MGFLKDLGKIIVWKGKIAKIIYGLKPLGPL